MCRKEEKGWLFLRSWIELLCIPYNNIIHIFPCCTCLKLLYSSVYVHGRVHCFYGGRRRKRGNQYSTVALGCVDVALPAGSEEQKGIVCVCVCKREEVYRMYKSGPGLAR